MADLTSDRRGAGDERLSASKSSEWVEMNEDGLLRTSDNGDSAQQQSRFQVAKVVPVDDRTKSEELAETDFETDANGFSSPVGSAVQRTLGNSNSYYDTKNLKSLRYYTREALPRADHYRNILSVHGHLTRPTLDELHGVQATIGPHEANKVRVLFLCRKDCSKNFSLKSRHPRGPSLQCKVCMLSADRCGRARAPARRGPDPLHVRPWPCTD